MCGKRHHGLEHLNMVQTKQTSYRLSIDTNVTYVVDPWMNFERDNGTTLF
jgi:hypothetical protein